MIDSYAWSGGREAMMRFGPASGPVVIAALPLFEEANRTRAFVLTILRQLATRGFAGALPDLPGTGESLIGTEQATLSHWTEAFSSAAEALRPTYETVHVISFRGGALVDREAAAETRWHLSPLGGTAVTRELGRVALAAAKEAGLPFDPATLTSTGAAIEIAGNRLTRKLLAEIERAEPVATAPLRTVRLQTDPLTADRHVPGAPLWRRSDPDNDATLAALLADDIAGWIASCGG